MNTAVIKKIFSRLGRWYCLWIESMPYRNWFNPIVTIYLNFRSFPLKQAVKCPVFVYGWPKLFSLYGSMECVGTCKIGMIKFNQTNSGAPSNPGPNSAILNWGKIFFHGKCQVYTANKITVGPMGVLDLGANTKIMHYCNITAHKYVSIGDDTWITHRCQVLDSNYHFVADFNKRAICRYTKPIYIGKACWVCNTSTIAGGTKIPDYTIVASNSLVNKDFSDISEESIIGGIPAKYIATGFRRVDNPILQHEVGKFFLNNPNESFYPLEDGFDHSKFDRIE